MLNLVKPSIYTMWIISLQCCYKATGTVYTCTYSHQFKLPHGLKSYLKEGSKWIANLCPILTYMYMCIRHENILIHETLHTEQEGVAVQLYMHTIRTDGTCIVIALGVAEHCDDKCVVFPVQALHCVMKEILCGLCYQQVLLA